MCPTALVSGVYRKECLCSYRGEYSLVQPLKHTDAMGYGTRRANEKTTSRTDRQKENGVLGSRSKSGHVNHGEERMKLGKICLNAKVLFILSISVTKNEPPYLKGNVWRGGTYKKRSRRQNAMLYPLLKTLR